MNLLIKSLSKFSFFVNILSSIFYTLFLSLIVFSPIQADDSKLCNAKKTNKNLPVSDVPLLNGKLLKTTLFIRYCNQNPDEDVIGRASKLGYEQNILKLGIELGPDAGEEVLEHEIGHVVDIIEKEAWYLNKDHFLKFDIKPIDVSNSGVRVLECGCSSSEFRALAESMFSKPNNLMLGEHCMRAPGFGILLDPGRFRDDLEPLEKGRFEILLKRLAQDNRRFEAWKKLKSYKGKSRKNPVQGYSGTKEEYPNIVLFPKEHEGKFIFPYDDLRRADLIYSAEIIDLIPTIFIDDLKYIFYSEFNNDSPQSSHGKITHFRAAQAQIWVSSRMSYTNQDKNSGLIIPKSDKDIKSLAEIMFWASQAESSYVSADLSQLRIKYDFRERKPYVVYTNENKILATDDFQYSKLKIGNIPRLSALQLEVMGKTFFRSPAHSVDVHSEIQKFDYVRREDWMITVYSTLYILNRYLISFSDEPQLKKIRGYKDFFKAISKLGVSLSFLCSDPQSALEFSVLGDLTQDEIKYAISEERIKKMIPWNTF